MSAREEDGVLVSVIDDRKANAFSEETLAALEKTLDAAIEASMPLVIAGRPGYFSAGLDLGVVRRGDPAEMAALGGAADRLFSALRQAPVPIVAACTGHALAAGSAILLCCDLRIGVIGDYGIGLIEVPAGMALPGSVIELAERRLGRQFLLRATVLGERWAPQEAMEVGFLDGVVEEDVIGSAVQEARTLGALSPDAYRQTKANFHSTVRTSA